MAHERSSSTVIPARLHGCSTCQHFANTSFRKRRCSGFFRSGFFRSGFFRSGFFRSSFLRSCILRSCILRSCILCGSTLSGSIISSGFERRSRSSF
jgi:uncharacterized protein YjbI with pentapeptide repeats